MDSIFRARFVWYRCAAVATGWLLATLAGVNQLEGIFGLAGVLLALPASATFLAGLRHPRARYPGRDLYKS